MVLKSLKRKSRDFIFKSYGNMETGNPGTIVFSRFPLPDEHYMRNDGNHAVIDSKVWNEYDGSRESNNKIVNVIAGNMIANHAAGRFDLRRFLGECVERFDNVIYDETEIKTVDDFFRVLPEEAAFKIAEEAFFYAIEPDEFRAEDKKKSS